MHKTAPTIAWVEIPVRDLDRATDFYRAILGRDIHMDETGPTPQAILGVGPGGPGAHIFAAKTTPDMAGPILHLSVPHGVEAARERCIAAGGTAIGEIVAILPGRFAYATDPDGNRLGLFEASGG